MFKLFLILPFILFFSCTQEIKEKPIEIDDLIQEGKSPSQKAIEAEKKHRIYDSLNIISKHFIDSLQLREKNFNIVDSLMYPDRFSPKKSQKWSYMSNDSSCYFASWTFKDSLAVKNAFLNWMDCYGEACKSIPIYSNVYLDRKNTNFIIATQQELIYFTSNKVFQTEKLKNQLFPLEEKFLFVIFQAKNKKAEWLEKSWNNQ